MGWFPGKTPGPTIAALASMLVIASLIALGADIGVAATAPPFWSEQPPAVTPATVAAPDWVALAKALKPAVVNIRTQRTERARDAFEAPDPDTPFGDFFRQFRGHPAPHVLHGLGSGFILSSGGIIVTNNHVIDGATQITVTMSDGREFTATVLGRDAKTDLALVKIGAQGLPVISLGDSAQLEVGEPVMAIGNPFGLEQTVTTGIVSATGRVIGEGPYDDFIQTDAAINPGNSGGPLINARGQAVGVNTAIFSRTGGSVGVGFAIPTNLAKPVLTQLASTGHVQRGWLGVTIQRVTPQLARGFGLPEAHGALVSNVASGSPAARAEIRSGDVIIEYNGRPVARSDDLPRAVAETPIGETVPVTVVRDGHRLALRARVARLKDDETSVEPAVAGQPEKEPLGLSVQTVTADVARELGLDQAHGVLIRDVRDDSPAANAGLRPGDVIVAVDRQPVTNVSAMKRVLQEHRAGAPTLFLVHRDGSTLYVPVG